MHLQRDLLLAKAVFTPLPSHAASWTAASWWAHTTKHRQIWIWYGSVMQGSVLLSLVSSFVTILKMFWASHCISFCMFPSGKTGDRSSALLPTHPICLCRKPPKPSLHPLWALPLGHACCHVLVWRQKQVRRTRGRKGTSQQGSAKWEKIGPKALFYFTAYSFYKLPTRLLPDSSEQLLANILVKRFERKPCVRELMCEEVGKMFQNWNMLCICESREWQYSSWGFLTGDGGKW